MSGDDWETPFDEVWGDVPRLLHRWKASSLGASSFCKSSFILFSFPLYIIFYFIIIIFFIIATFPIYHLYIVKKRPKLKSKYRHPVEAAVEYTKTIDDFDDLVYPQTLARHCLGLEPFAYVLRAIEIEEKKNECSFWLVTALGSLSSIIIFFLQGILFCKDDVKIQSVDVHPDKG